MTEAEKQILFEDVFKLYFHQLYVHALGWLQDEESAKDVVHDSYCYLWEHFDRYDAQSNLLALLYTFVRSRCADQLRHREVVAGYADRYRAEYEAELSVDYEGYNERIERVMRAVRMLPPQTRRVFVACVLHRLSYKEVGERLGISPLTVKTLMARAFKFLRTQKEFFSPIVVLLLLSPSVL